MSTFRLRRELAEVLNRHSKENGSDTPDLVLAGYLTDCLSAFDSAVRERERWYGRGEQPVKTELSAPDSAAAAMEKPEQQC